MQVIQDTYFSALSIINKKKRDANINIKIPSLMIHGDMNGAILVFLIARVS